MDTHAPTSRFSRWAVSLFLAIYLMLLVGIALMPDWMGSQLGALTVGQWWVIFLHTVPVATAWWYIRLGLGLDVTTGDDT